ncbi:hypothetical protein NDN08_001516 [Rhodosorus marinus]|uniref:Uncharacterized protein n=1 Tax=Rhodosorus marinus TaxID=101924 RepID=A0AAV8USI0_9RHOD|nr:hypothetical protein NDN08_001516 [Rhodosorus marinus]
MRVWIILWILWVVGVLGEDTVHEHDKVLERVETLLSTLDERKHEVSELTRKKVELSKWLEKDNTTSRTEEKLRASVGAVHAKEVIDEGRVELHDLERRLSELELAKKRQEQLLIRLVDRVHEALENVEQNNGKTNWVAVNMVLQYLSIRFSGVDQHVIPKRRGAEDLLHQNVSKVDSISGQLSDHLTAEMRKRIHWKAQKSPSMRPALYFLLFIPILSVTVAAIVLVETSMRFTGSHLVLLGSIYLLIVFVGFSLSSLILHSEMNVFLMLHHAKLLLLMIISFGVVVGIVGLQAFVTNELKQTSQFFALLSIAVHYCLCAWRPLYSNRPPRMYISYYLIYESILCAVIYENSRGLGLSRKLDKFLEHWEWVGKTEDGDGWPQPIVIIFHFVAQLRRKAGWKLSGNKGGGGVYRPVLPVKTLDAWNDSGSDGDVPTTHHRRRRRKATS